MRRPLLIPGICFAGGILCEWWGRFDLPWLFVSAFAAFTIVVAWRDGRALLFPLVMFLIGSISAGLRVVPYSPSDLRLVAGPVPALVTVSGRVAKEPELQRGTRSDEARPHWRVVIDAESLDGGGKLSAVRGRVMVFSKGPVYEKLRRGARVSVFGVLSRPSSAAAVGLFDYREKLRREGIHQQLMTLEDSDWREIEDVSGVGFARRFQTWAVRRLGAGLGNDDGARLLVAMVLGLRTGLTDEVAEPFMRSGTMHIFAISGLHVAMVAGILVMLLRVSRVPRAWCGLVVVPALWFYCHATGWQASATRATIMMSIIVAGWSLRRPVDLLNSVCAAGFLILLWDPLQLLQASFQLSFAVVTTIALTWPRFDELGERLFAGDPLLPRELESWWWRKSRLAARWLYSMLAISFSAWLGSMPLIAFYFHLWTPGSLIANPPVVLITMFAISSAMGGLLLGLVFPALGEVFGHGAWFWIRCQMEICARVAEIPRGWTFVIAPSGAEIVIYFGLLLGWGLRWWSSRRLAGVAIGLIACGVLIRQQRPVEITVFGREANAIFCDLKGEADDLLIDCGRREGMERVVVPFARSRGIGRIPNLLLSHGDAAHVEGFDIAAEAFSPVVVWASGVRQRSVVYQKALAAAGRTGVVQTGGWLGSWRVLHPSPERKLVTADAAAVILKGEIGGVTLLVLPDASRIAQSRILERWDDMEVDVLIVGWPKEGETILDEFLDRTRPEMIVVQDNRTPVFDRAGGELLRRLRSRCPEVLTVSQSGSITLGLADGRWSVETMGR
jgi:competence protein ComEC